MFCNFIFIFYKYTEVCFTDNCFTINRGFIKSNQIVVSVQLDNSSVAVSRSVVLNKRKSILAIYNHIVQKFFCSCNFFCINYIAAFSFIVLCSVDCLIIVILYDFSCISSKRIIRIHVLVIPHRSVSISPELLSSSLNISCIFQTDVICVTFIVIKESVVSNIFLVQKESGIFTELVFQIVWTFNKTQSLVFTAFHASIISTCQCTQFFPGSVFNYYISNIKRKLSAIYVTGFYAGSFCNDMNK